MNFAIDWMMLFFCAFAAMTLFSALCVVFSKNPVYAVLSLVLCFVSMAGGWMLLQAEFLSLVLIVVYVGAVMVLFLFVVMMLNMNLAPMQEGFARYLPIGLLIGACFVAQLLWIFHGSDLTALGLGHLPKKPEDYSSITELGMSLYTHYIYPVEMAGVILLVAIIAAIGLSLRPPRDRRSQNIPEQVRVRKSERLTVLAEVTPDSPLNMGERNAQN